MTAVSISVTAWLILSRLQGLAKNTVKSGQNSDMSTKGLPVCAEFSLNVGCEVMFGTLIFI
jgi:hypothetical protein